MSPPPGGPGGAGGAHCSPRLGPGGLWSWPAELGAARLPDQGLEGAGATRWGVDALTGRSGWLTGRAE